MPDSQTIFIAVGSTGFLILLISVLLGEIGGHGGEFGGHPADVGEHGGEVSGHSGDVGAEGTAAGAHGVPEGSADLDAPTWRSIRVLAVALVGFGAGGFVATSSGVPALLAWPLAAAGFLAVGAAAYRFILKPLAAQQYNSLTSRYGWIGRTGVVTLDILPHGTGQVTFHDRQGARITQTASSDLSEGVPKGSAVTITALASGGVVVHRSAFSD